MLAQIADLVTFATVWEHSQGELNPLGALVRDGALLILGPEHVGPAAAIAAIVLATLKMGLIAFLVRFGDDFGRYRWVVMAVAVVAGAVGATSNVVAYPNAAASLAVVGAYAIVAIRWPRAVPRRPRRRSATVRRGPPRDRRPRSRLVPAMAGRGIRVRARRVSATVEADGRSSRDRIRRIGVARGLDGGTLLRSIAVAGGRRCGLTSSSTPRNAACSVAPSSPPARRSSPRRNGADSGSRTARPPIRPRRRCPPRSRTTCAASSSSID